MDFGYLMLVFIAMAAVTFAEQFTPMMAKSVKGKISRSTFCLLPLWCF